MASICRHSSLVRADRLAGAGGEKKRGRVVGGGSRPSLLGLILLGCATSLFTRFRVVKLKKGSDFGCVVQHLWDRCRECPSFSTFHDSKKASPGSEGW